MGHPLELNKYLKTLSDSYLGRCTARRGFRNAKELEKRSNNEENMKEKRNGDGRRYITVWKMKNWLDLLSSHAGIGL